MISIGNLLNIALVFKYYICSYKRQCMYDWDNNFIHLIIIPEEKETGAIAIHVYKK